MDIDKLIEQLRTESLYADKASLEIMDLCMDAAATLSTLQIENQALRNAANGFKAENKKLRAELNDLRTQWDMYGGDEGITSTFAELEQARAEITRLKHYEDKCHDCPIVCAKAEIIKAHEELEAIQAELEQAKRNQCLGADCPWKHTAI